MSRPETPAWRIPAFPQAGWEQREAFEAAASGAGAPARFYCPMSHRILQDPVMLYTGQSFERRYIERWVELGQTTCPQSGKELPQPVTYTSNTALRHEIAAWCRDNVHLPATATPDAQATITAFSIDSKDGSAHNFVADDFVMAMELQEEELDVYTAKTRLPRIRTRDGSTPSAPSMHSGLDSPETPIRSSWSLLAFRILVSAAYIVLYILALWKAGWDLENINFNPLVGPNRAALAQFGSLVNSRVQQQNQWWRVPSSLFVSSGVIQLFCALVCLWVLVHHLERSSRLWRPQLTIPGIFLVSGITAAVTAVSLAYDQDSTGASAGVCALLGAVWMEQLTCWRRVPGRWITIIVLVLLTGVFAILSLIPLVGMWYTAVAFLCGALLLPVTLLPPRARDRKSRRSILWALKLSAAAIVLALLVLGILSVVLNDSQKAQECPFCREANCVEIRSWWKCENSTTLQATASACQFAQNQNGTSTVTCPTGALRLLTGSQISDRAAACNQACAVANTFDSSNFGPTSAGVLI